MSKRIRATFIILGTLAIGQVIWWAYLLISQQNLISSPDMIEKSERFKMMILFEGAFFIFFWGFSLFWLYRSYFSHILLKNTRDNFLGAISHEIKTPIANVQLCIETLERPNIDDQKKQKYLSKATLALKQLNVLVENLLTLTTLENIKNTKSQIHLLQFTQDLLGKMDIDAQKKNVVLNIPESHKIEANLMAAELIVKSILENSFKYNMSQTPEIRITSQQTPKTTELSIQDNGIGLDPDELKKVFEPFWRSQRTIEKAQAGTGVGLTLASELARKNKMQLKVQSPGHNLGSTFTITWSNL